MAPTASSARQTRRATPNAPAPKTARPVSTAPDTASKAPLSAKDKNQDRINRKRVQNRISQQCVREKQLAHQKRLEALAEIFKATTETAGSTTENRNAMLNNQMSLIEENRDLRDALLRMRKKMLSLSSAVAAVADDPIFETILQKPKKKKETQIEDKEDQLQSSTIVVDPTPEGPHDQPRSNTQAIVVEGIGSGNHASSLDFDGMPMSNFDNHTESMQSSSPHSTSSTQSIPPLDNIHGSFVDSSIVNSTTFDFAMENMIDQNMLLLDDIDLDTSATSHPWNLFQPDVMSNARFVQQGVRYEFPRFTLIGDNNWKIEQACIWYLSERFGIPGQLVGTHQEARSCYNSTRLAIAKLDTNRNLVADVSKAAVDVMCRTTGTTDYIYGVGANECMEQVFQWRLAPSNHTRLAIMEPFRPTPLQYMSNDYPISIDFVNWPTIRDQLIFKYGTYDFDQVVADIVANTVIELPEVRAAINIHDTFFTRVWSKSAATNRAGNLGKPISEGGFGEWEASTTGNSTVGWTSNDVFAFVAHKIRMADSQPLDSRATSGSWGELVRLDRTAPKQPLATKWGLDSLSRWKLSREFAEAYPFLDCSSAVASFPLYSSKMVPEV